MKKKTQQQRALALAAEVLGQPVDMPVETLSDLMAQAQATLNYFQAPGEFSYKECWECAREFAYCWNRQGILYCSVTCMSKALERKGMTWDPGKAPEKRWGKTIPAVVPPEALELIREDEPEPEPDETVDDLLAELGL